MYVVEFSEIDVCKELYRIVYRHNHGYDVTEIPDDYDMRLIVEIHGFPENWMKQLKYPQIKFSDADISKMFRCYKEKYNRICREYKANLRLNFGELWCESNASLV